MCSRYEEPDQWVATVARQLAAELDIHFIVAQVLVARGIDAPEEAQRFVRPRLGDLEPPIGLADFSGAVERLAVAALQGEQVGIFGDYDVDGITSTAVVALYLRKLGLNPVVRLAHRDRGYGLKPGDIDFLAARGCRLIVACDVGTSDVEALQWARDHNLDVLVFDHHQVPDLLPPTTALVNPARHDSTFPDPGLASVGLTFYLVAALRTRLQSEQKWAGNLPDPREMLDLVALGTVADVAPLTGGNRVMVSYGLKMLGGSPRVGLKALAQVAGLEEGRTIGVREVAFNLAPRLNAAGRLGDAAPAFDLVTESDPDRARSLARQLDELNQTRRQLQQSVLEAAEQQVRWGQAGDSVLVVDGQGWHPGVVGIVAARLAETYVRPAVVIALGDDGLGRGSGRSDGRLDLYESLSLCGDTLVSFGGHAAAAGLVVRRDRIGAFRQAINAVANQSGHTETRTWQVDAVLSLSDVDEHLMRGLDILEPTGAGNPAPQFLARSVRVDAVRVVGRGGDHLSMVLCDGPVSRSAIGFSMGSRAPAVGSTIDVVFTPEWDLYRGGIQLRIVDF